MQKLEEMDLRISKNFNTMFNALSKKIDEAQASRQVLQQEGPTYSNSRPTSRQSATLQSSAVEKQTP